MRTTAPVPPEKLFPCYDQVFESLRQAGHLESWRVLQDKLLIALDGTWYYSSQKIHCPNCSSLEHKSGEKTYYHSAITPVLAAPGHEQAIALRPEFITPQDGHTKQDCEIAAAKRWLEKNAAQYAPLRAILLGDDIYSHQPFCRRTQLHGFDFIFVCKPESHPTLYHWVNLLQRPPLGTLTARIKVGAHFHTYAYRYANDVPLAEGDDALKVNWCEVTVTDHKGKVVYLNGFITNFKTTDQNVAALVAAGRARWKIENENNHTLKTKGYPPAWKEGGMVLVRCWSDTVEGVGRRFSEVIKWQFPADLSPKCSFLTTCLAWFPAQLSKPPLRIALGHPDRGALAKA